MTKENMESKLVLSLFLLRVGVGIVFFMWTIDKLLNPEHIARVFAAFYMIPSLSTITSYAIGATQLVVVLAFLSGALKRYSYAAIFIMYLISTVSTYGNYFDPWPGINFLFFAAFPMLAACWALWSLRDYDIFFAIESHQENSAS